MPQMLYYSFNLTGRFYSLRSIQSVLKSLQNAPVKSKRKISNEFHHGELTGASHNYTFFGEF